MKSLHDLLCDEIADAYDAEGQLTKALPKIAKAAQNEELRTAIESHLEETKEHVRLLEEAYQAIGESKKAKKCQAMVGLLKEGDELLSQYKDSPSLDAAIIAAAQKVEHYEIATYGTLLAWANQLELTDAAGIFETILKQEKAADAVLTELACDEINDTAETGAEKQTGAAETSASARRAR